MLAMVEMLEREKQSQEKKRKRERKKDIKFGEARGKKEERIFIAKKMLKENLDIKIIQKITGLKKEQFM